jgi:hypothetical protein
VIIEGPNKSMGRNSTLLKSDFCSAFLSLLFLISLPILENKKMCVYFMWNTVCQHSEYVSLLCPLIKEFSIILVEGSTGSIFGSII